MEQGTHLDAAGVGAATATRERASRARQRASRARDTTAKSPALPTNVRVAIYLRISTDEEHQPFSLDAQRHRLESFIPTQPGWSHVATYEDQTSGAKASRPDLDRAMRDARLGRFDVLLVYRVDRFARSLKVLVHLLEELESNGVAFRSATEPIDTSTATGRMLVQLLGVFAEFERATIIDRVVNGMERKAARGGWPGGPLPHGLALDDNDHLAVRAEEFPLVERIFARYAEGDTGAVGIATELNEDGHRTRNGRLWSAKGVLDILRNRSYVGEVHWRGSWYRSSDPLIDAELFERVQALLNERGEGYDRRFTARHPEYLLTGLVKCGRCNRAYVGVSAHGKKHRYRYYVCWSRARYGASGCEGERVRADELEMAVFEALAAMYDNPDLLREAVAAQEEDAQASAQRHAEELATLEAEIAKTEASVERYMLAFENGTITEEMFGERVRDLGTKAAALRSRRDDLRAALDAGGRSPLPTAEEIAALRDSLRDAAQHASDAVRKLITQAFVHELRVVSRDRIDPMFRVLRGLPYMPDGAGQASDPAGTGVRAMTPNVGEERVVRYVEEWLPGLETWATTATTCLYATTPDDRFLVERTGRIVVAAGFSGHGFKHAPVVARHVAALATAES